MTQVNRTLALLPHPSPLLQQENLRASNTTTRYHHRNMYVTSKTCTVAEYREYMTPKTWINQYPISIEMLKPSRHFQAVLSDPFGLPYVIVSLLMLSCALELKSFREYLQNRIKSALPNQLLTICAYHGLDAFTIFDTWASDGKRKSCLIAFASFSRRAAMVRLTWQRRIQMNPDCTKE